MGPALIACHFKPDDSEAWLRPRVFHLWSSILLRKKWAFSHAEKSYNLLTRDQPKDVGPLRLPERGSWRSWTWPWRDVAYLWWLNRTDSFKFCLSRPKTEAWESIVVTVLFLCPTTAFPSWGVGEQISWCLGWENYELWGRRTAYSSLIKRKPSILSDLFSDWVSRPHLESDLFPEQITTEKNGFREARVHLLLDVYLAQCWPLGSELFVCSFPWDVSLRS